MHIQLKTYKDAISYPLKKLTDYSRMFIIFVLKTNLFDNLWTCQSTGWQTSSLHGTYRIQASQQNLYILSEYFHGVFLYSQADIELEEKLKHKLENKN